jgi:hypothetical protein
MGVAYPRFLPPGAPPGRLPPGRGPLLKPPGLGPDFEKPPGRPAGLPPGLPPKEGLGFHPVRFSPRGAEESLNGLGLRGR